MTTTVNENVTFKECCEISTPGLTNDEQFLFVKESDLPIIMFVDLLEFVGILGNLHAFFIYLFLFKNSIHRTFILYLAFVDLMTCIFEIPYYTIWYLNAYNSQKTCQTLLFIHTAPSGSSLIVLCFIAIDRFLKVCRPLGTQFSPRQVVIGLSFITLYMVSLYGFGASLHGLKFVYTNTLPPRIVGHRCGITNIKHFTSYVYTLIALLNSVVCLVVSGVIYILICNGLVKRRRLIKRMTHNEQSQHELNEVDSRKAKWYLVGITNTKTLSKDDNMASNHTDNLKMKSNKEHSSRDEVAQKTSTFDKAIHSTMMFGVATLVSYFGIFCFTAVSVARGLVDSKKLLSLDESVSGFIDALGRLYILNHVVNPYIYCLMNPKFRRKCKEAYKRCFDKIRCCLK